MFRFLRVLMGILKKTFVLTQFCLVGTVLSQPIFYGTALAGCAGTAKGFINIQVERCSVITPSQYFSKPENLPIWVSEMAPLDAKSLLSRYKGILVTGLIKKSNAVIKSGLSKSKHALRGNTVTVFTSSFAGCQGLGGKQLNGMLTEECCDGGGEVPCLLNQTYRLDQAKSFVTAKPVSKFKQSKLSKKGKMYFKDRSYSKAIVYLEKAYQKKQLDVFGKWNLAAAYEKKNDCGRALVPLRDIYQQWVQGNTSGKDDIVVGSSILLLARCYARDGKINKANKTLSALLKHPKKFKKQIRQGMIHSDFRFIKSTAGYREFYRRASMVIKNK